VNGSTPGNQCTRYGLMGTVLENAPLRGARYWTDCRDGGLRAAATLCLRGMSLGVWEFGLLEEA